MIKRTFTLVYIVDHNATQEEQHFFPLGEGYHNYHPNTDTLMSKVRLFLEFKLLMQLTFLSINNKINGKNIIIKMRKSMVSW